MSWASSSRCLRIPPARIALAGVTSPWQDAPRDEIAAFLDTLARQPLSAPSFRLRRAASARVRRVVRQSRVVAGDRLPRAAETALRNDRDPAIPAQSASAHGWKIIDASALDRDLDLEADVAIVGTGAGGGIAAEILAQSGPRGDPDRGRAARHIVATSACANRKPIRALPGVGGAQDARQGDQHPAGALRGRRHDGQLDELVSHARHDPCVLAARTSDSRDSRPSDLAPWFARDGDAARHRTVERAAEREQRSARAGRSGARHPIGRHPAQRQRLLEPRLLRHGLPDQREAVDAGHDDSRGARPRRNPRHPRPSAARSPTAASGSPRSPAQRWTRAAFTRPRGGSSMRARAFVAAARRDRHARAPAAKPRPGSARPRRQAHVPASDGRLRCADARASRRVRRARRRRSTPTTFSTRVPVDGPIGFKLEAPPLHPMLWRSRCPGQGRAHARWMRELPHLHVADRAAARRLSSGQPGRHGDARRRWRAGARLSADAVCLGRRAPRAARDGRDPVRRGRRDRHADPRRRRRVHELGRRTVGDRRVRARAARRRRSSART